MTDHYGQSEITPQEKEKIMSHKPDGSLRTPDQDAHFGPAAPGRDSAAGNREAADAETG